MRFRHQVLLLFLVLILHPSSFVLSQVVVVEKPEFRQLVPADATVEKLAGGFKFTEGPAYNPVDRLFVFSDERDDRIYRYDPATHSAPLWRHPSGMSNGNIFNARGDFFSCEQGPHRVSVTHPDGTTEEYPDGWQGKAFSSPNDIAVKSDGTVWFTDPPYGLAGRKREQATNNVYCYNPKTKEMRAVAYEFRRAERTVALRRTKRSSTSRTPDARITIRVFDVSADKPTHGAAWCSAALDKGVPDGIRCDAAGNVVVQRGRRGAGVQPDGRTAGAHPRAGITREPVASAGRTRRVNHDLYLAARSFAVAG